MVPYVIAGAVAVVLLIAAYRALGGSATTQPDPSRVVSSVVDAAADVLRSMDALPADGPPRSASLGMLRRRLDGCAQLLQQVDAAALDRVTGVAHAEMTAGIDELGWCVRLLQSPAHETAPGIREAAAMLREHGARCIAAARALQPESARAEEVEGAR